MLGAESAGLTPTNSTEVIEGSNIGALSFKYLYHLRGSLV